VKIQLASDLHLEADPEFRLRPAPGAELLVLAGDVGSYQRGSRLGGDDFGLACYSPRAGWPQPVVFVPGNHEYDQLDFDETHERLRETCQRLGIQWLERESLVLQGVRFLGTTLWTDFEALAKAEPDARRKDKAIDRAMRAANFYLQRNTALRAGQPLMAPGWRELGLACQQWLRDELAKPFDGATVVVTHFAPSLRSADPRYGLTPGTAGFCNELPDLLAQADAWMHGHLHCPHDYVAHGCRVVSNTLGYASKGEQQGFREQFIFDTADLAGREPVRPTVAQSPC
jgi:predicted phosphodiesterase